jgi:hypothetical protein
MLQEHRPDWLALHTEDISDCSIYFRRSVHAYGGEPSVVVSEVYADEEQCFLVLEVVSITNDEAMKMACTTATTTTQQAPA